MRSRIRGLALATLAAIVQSGAFAQTIRIPDFREGGLPLVAPGDPCNTCGVVQSVREVHRRRDSPSVLPNPGPPGSMDARVVGAIVVLPFGPGSSDRNTFVGGAGTPEMNERFGESSYQLVLRMDDGSYRTLERRDGGRYAIGDRVRLAEGKIDIAPPR